MSFRLEHIHLKVANPKETRDFFVDKLGASLLEELANGYRVDLHGLALNITTFAAGQTREQHYGIEHIAIETDEIAGAVEEMTGGGAKILEEVTTPDGRKVCFLQDSDGVQFEMMEMAKH